MKNKILIFDMDGVLVDSIQIARDSIGAGYLGLTEDIQKEIMCGNFFDEIKKYSHLRKPETEGERKIRHIQYAENKSKASLFPGIKEFLKKMYRLQYIIVLNTSSYDRNCLPILEKEGIKQYFDFFATADLSKDKIEKFKLIKSKYYLDKKDALFITDTLGDVREADVAGVLTIAVTWGGHDRSFFEREKHPNLIGIVDTVKELEDFIEKY